MCIACCVGAWRGLFAVEEGSAADAANDAASAGEHAASNEQLIQQLQAFQVKPGEPEGSQTFRVPLPNGEQVELPRMPFMVPFED